MPLYGLGASKDKRAPVQPPPDVDFPQMQVRQRWWPRAHVLLALAFLGVLAAGFVLLWRMLGKEIAALSAPPETRAVGARGTTLPELRDKLRAVFATSGPEVFVSSIVVCTGTDASGKPTGAGKVFAGHGTEAKVPSAFFRFENAVPGKTRFAVRWTATGSVASTETCSPGGKTGALLVPCRATLSPGTHTVTLLVDGNPRSTATFDVVAHPTVPAP